MLCKHLNIFSHCNECSSYARLNTKLWFELIAGTWYDE